jgi:hypothetical protein
MLAATALAEAGPPAAMQPAAGAGLAALAVLLLPRLGWLLAGGPRRVWLAPRGPGGARVGAAGSPEHARRTRRTIAIRPRGVA